MKAARILIGAGLIFLALNLVAFLDLERRARAMEAQEALLVKALDSATSLYQTEPPPIGQKVIGIMFPHTIDEFPVIGIWDGVKFYAPHGPDYIRVIGYEPPAEWLPYPTK